MTISYFCSCTISLLDVNDSKSKSWMIWLDCCVNVAKNSIFSIIPSTWNFGQSSHRESVLSWRKQDAQPWVVLKYVIATRLEENLVLKTKSCLAFMEYFDCYINRFLLIWNNISHQTTSQGEARSHLNEWSRTRPCTFSFLSWSIEIFFICLNCPASGQINVFYGTINYTRYILELFAKLT